MATKELFAGRVEIIYSALSDGNMRFFEGDEQEIFKNQSRLIAQIGAEPTKTARVKTTYENRKNFTEYLKLDVTNVEQSNITHSEKDLPLADGIATQDTELGILLPLADCLGIVFYDQTTGTAALLHSGRHNLEEDGAYKFISFLQKNFGCKPEDLQIWFSPHALKYQIFKLDNKTMSEAAIEQLTRAGVNPSNIKTSAIDTVSSPDLPSNSSGDTKTRFAIGIRLAG